MVTTELLGWSASETKRMSSRKEEGSAEMGRPCRGALGAGGCY